jgi:hypothetical protein
MKKNKDVYDVGQMLQVQADAATEARGLNIGKNSNKFDAGDFDRIGEGITDHISRVKLGLLKKFLMDRNMLTEEGEWIGTPCLLDDEGNEVFFKADTLVIRDKWSR